MQEYMVTTVGGYKSASRVYRAENISNLRRRLADEYTSVRPGTYILSVRAPITGVLIGNMKVSNGFYVGMTEYEWETPTGKISEVNPKTGRLM